MIEVNPAFIRQETASARQPMGDWLLAFHGQGKLPQGKLPQRAADAAWTNAAAGPGWELLVTEPSTVWAGMPTLAFTHGDWQVWLLGELYATPRPRDLIAAILDGDTPAEQINGHCLLFAHYVPGNRWHLWTNRFATLHAYYATDGRRSAVGTFFPAVAAAAGRTELDWEGLTTFFGFGFFANDTTYLRGVRTLRPATHTVLDGDGQIVSQKRYWDWTRPIDHVRSYDETLEEFAGLFGDVMAGLTAKGRIGLPISGGLDSRSTVATVAAGGELSERVWAYSYGYGHDSVETAIARRLAAARGLRFDAFAIPPYLFDRLQQIVGSVEGFQDVTQARQASISNDLRRNADVVIAAHWGDVYLDDMGLAGIAAGSMTDDALIDHAARKISKLSDWLVAEIIRPQLGTPPEAVLRDIVAADLAGRTALGEPDFRVKAFKTDQWSARWTTASLRMYQAAAFPRLPFYDTRLSDFFATVPTEFVAGRRLQIDYLRRYAPDLAAVTWQTSGSDLFHAGRPDPLALPRRAIKKAARLATGRTVIERNWEVQFLGEAGRRALEGWLLRPGLRLHEFVAPDRLRGLLNEFYAAPVASRRAYAVCMLLTFSAWLELHSPGGGA